MSVETAPITTSSHAKAINLRDIGEVAPDKLRPKVLYRCSQIFDPALLSELKVKTVLDLRGRTEKNKLVHRDGPPKAAQDAAAPTLPATIDNEQITGHSQQQTNSNMPYVAEQSNFEVHRTSQSSLSEEPAGGGTKAPATKAIQLDVPTLDVESVSDQSPSAEQGGAGLQIVNLIPSRAFGMRLLRMPPSVWASSVKAWWTGNDFKRPFVLALANEQVLGFTKFYILILEHGRKSIAQVLRAFTTSSNAPLLVHCAHGKDRTGIIVMLLLMLCEVPHEAIIKDYEASDTALRAYRVSLGVDSSSSAIPLDDVIIASTTTTITNTIDYIIKKYGDIESYLATCGVTKEEMIKIRQTLMKEGTATPFPRNG